MTQQIVSQIIHVRVSQDIILIGELYWCTFEERLVSSLLLKTQKNSKE